MNPKSGLNRELTGQITLLSLAVYMTALLSLIFVYGDWQTSILLASGILITSAIVIFTSKESIVSIIDIVSPRKEVLGVLIWYFAYFIFNLLTTSEGVQILGDFAQPWIMLVIIPLIILILIRGEQSSFKQTIKSLGFTKIGFWPSIKLGAISSIIMIPFIMLSTNTTQRTAIYETFNNPVKGIIYFVISFAIAFILFAFTEEFFFRGFLQSRIAKITNSEWIGVLISSFLFGMYHLPNLYLNISSQSHGNFIWSVVIAITEQGITGILLGCIWSKTHNITGAMLLHAFIDAFMILASLKIV